MLYCITATAVTAWVIQPRVLAVELDCSIWASQIICFPSNKIRATPTPFGAKIATSVENRQKYNFKKSLHFAKLYIFKFKILFFILCGSKRAFLFLIFCRTTWIKVITDTKLQIYNSSCSLLICPAENRISIRYATLLNEKKHSII